METSNLTERDYQHFNYLAKKYGYFSVKLIEKKANVQITLHDIKTIVNDIIKPIVNNSTEGFLYNDGDKSKFNPDNSDLFQRYRKLHKIKISQDLFLDMNEFWGGGALFTPRGSILFLADSDKINLQELYSKTFNPGIITNLKGSLPQSLIKRAQNTVETDNDQIAFVFHHYGLSYLTIFISKENIKNYMTLALNTCKLTYGKT